MTCPVCLLEPSESPLWASSDAESILHLHCADALLESLLMARSGNAWLKGIFESIAQRARLILVRQEEGVRL